MSVDEQARRDWFLAEYEMAWTTQSEVNSRINTVYSAAMSISVALLGVLAVWALGFPKVDDPDLPAPLRALIFVLPNAITLPMFSHNLGQRRAIVQLAAYWKVMIDAAAHRPTWASRIELYREALGAEARFSRLRSEANDPIPASYWSVYWSSLVFAVASCFFTNLPKHGEFGLLLIPVFGAVGILLVELTHQWRRVITHDLPDMTAAWQAVQAREREAPADLA